MCKGRSFALKQAMMFTAAIVAMWDVEHAGGDDWVMPKRRKTPGVFGAEDK